VESIESVRARLLQEVSPRGVVEVLTMNELFHAGRVSFRALKELRRLQTNRILRSMKLTDEDEPQVPVLADINEMTKQTRSERTAVALNTAIRLVDPPIGSPRLKVIRDRAAVSSVLDAARRR
jgi:hypothetical protein